MVAFYDKVYQLKWLLMQVRNASPVGLGLYSCKKGAVSFASRSLSDVERQYSQTEKEACERLHLNLSG